MAKLLLISNGHGEDVSGALLATELQRIGHQVEAFPLVGKGNAYQNEGIKIHGFRREFSTGGIGYTSLIGRFTELVQGQIFYLALSILRLLKIVSTFDLLIVVGDVVPLLAAWISNRKTVVYLVAYSSHYEGKLRLPWPASFCLKSKRVLEIYSRDKLTAEDLTVQLNRPIIFLGNPFMDPVLTPRNKLPQRVFRLGILPGSRRPELDNNLLMILHVLKCLPNSFLTASDFSLDMALVNAMGNEELLALVSKDGWHCMHESFQTSYMKLVNGSCRLTVHRDSFVELLQSSDLLLCMAGTAAEQAIGLAKPVIQLPGRGPQFTSSFAEAQRRLLGKTVFCAKEDSFNKRNLFLETANLILLIFNQLHQDSQLKNDCVKEALCRLGSKGGTQRITSSINELIFKFGLHE